MKTLRKLSSLLLMIALLLVGCGQTTADVTPTAPAAPTPTLEPTASPEPTEAPTPEPTATPAPTLKGKTEIKILMIGNSYAVHASNMLGDILKKHGFKKVTIGVLHAGSCSIDTHRLNFLKNSPVYDYYKFDGYSWNITKEYKGINALTEEAWDLISMQQVSGDSGRPETYANLQWMIDKVNEKKTNPDAIFAWHMTWSYEEPCTFNPDGFAKYYESSSRKMFELITKTTQETVLPKGVFTYLIPTGTAIENARTTSYGQAFNSDTAHLNSLGKFVAGYTWLAALTGEPVTEFKYKPSDVKLTDAQKAELLWAINAAVEKPFEVSAQNN